MLEDCAGVWFSFLRKKTMSLDKEKLSNSFHLSTVVDKPIVKE